MSILALLFLLQAAPPPAEPDTACYVHETTNGVSVMRYMGDRACVDFDPPRTIEGVWVNAFEGSAFYEGAKDVADIRGRPPTTWLTLDEASLTPPDFKPALRYPAHAYRLTFVGKTAKDMQRGPLSGYGHMGMSRGLVLVDQLTQWRDLGSIKVTH